MYSSREFDFRRATLGTVQGADHAQSCSHFCILDDGRGASVAQQTEMDRAETELRDAMAPAASAGATVKRVAPDEIRIRMPSDITFDFNRADLKYEFMPRIQQLAQSLRGHPGMSINIVGHADAIRL